jgi:hypothetical protein
MGPRIYPSQQDTNLNAKGSLIINYLDIFENVYNDYMQVSVNGQLRSRDYNEVIGLYKTNLNIGDVVLIELTSDVILFKNITVFRRDYSTDDNGGDNGITDSLITFNNSDTTTISLTFTATTIPSSYNFEYRVEGNIGTNPTQDCAINGLSFDYDGAYSVAGTIGEYSRIYQTYLKYNSGSAFLPIDTGPAVYLEGATLNFEGNIINYTTQYGQPRYSLTSGSLFSASTISYNTSIQGWSDMDCNIDGTYQTVGQYSGSLYLSSNSGQTYTTISNSIKYWTKPVIPNNSGFPFYAITNTVGDYLYKINSTTGVTQVTAAKAPTYVFGQTSLTGTSFFQSVAISQDTKYIALVYRSLGDTVAKDFSYMWSSDSGNTFSFILVSNGTYGCLMYDAKIAMSKDGKYIYIINNRTNINRTGDYFYSHNYGSTWVWGNPTSTAAGMSISCSATGKYVYKGVEYNSGPSLEYSSNYGVTFSGIPISNYGKFNKN